MKHGNFEYTCDENPANVKKLTVPDGGSLCHASACERHADCFRIGMAIGPLINLAGSVVDSLIHRHTGSAAANSTPFAQVLSSLEAAQQTSPTQYRALTRQISDSLHAGAQSATATGNSVLAGQLSRLSADFTVASNSGQLPNVPDLAQAFPANRVASPAATIIGTVLHL